MDADQPQVPNAIQELRQAKSKVEQVTKSLENQKKILKQRGMNLPPMVLQTLKQVRADVTKLEATLVEEQTELGQLRALATMSANVNTTLDVDVVLEEAMDIVIALTRAERGYIILVDDATDALDFRVSRDNTPTAAHASKHPQISRTIVQEVVSKQQPLLADNAYKDQRLQGSETVADFALRSVLCVPLVYKGDAMGAVYVDNRLQAGIFTERELNTLMAFANTAAVAIANAQLFADIRQTLTEITQVKDLMDDVLASIGSGLIAADAVDNISTFNRAAEEILEIDADDVLEKPLQTVLPRITADLHDSLTKIREQDEFELIEADIANTKGERVAISLKLSPLRDSNNDISGVAMVLDDITEKRERDNQLRVMKTYLPPEMVDQIHEISQLALGGVKREVTCVFAEVRPLATMKDVRPSEIMDTLNTFFRVATACVHEAQGVVDKYMGTEVMALWNTQLSPQDDHARLALECALLMRDRFVALYEELGIAPEPHFYRVGLHTGEATLGNVGSLNRRDFTAIGDTINLSKRLEETATRGQIIISQATRDHIEAHSTSALPYRFRERDPIQVKGRQQKTRIYEVFRQHA
jgi:adenylate cyclase